MLFRDSKGFMAKRTLKSSILGILNSYLVVVDRKKILKIMTFFLKNAVT